MAVFLYGELAPGRGPSFFRRGGTDELARRLAAGELAPDFGPPRLDERAGGALVGARRPLIAFNVDLADADVAVAQAIAAVVRERGGGFPGVRALGLDLPRAGRVQVSMNVEDWEAAALHEIVARIENEAAERGARVLGSELVGLMPAGAAAAAAGAQLRIPGFDASRVLELRLLRRTRASAKRGLDSPRGAAHGDRPHRRCPDDRRRLGGSRERGAGRALDVRRGPHAGCPRAGRRGRAQRQPPHLRGEHRIRAFRLARDPRTAGGGAPAPAAAEPCVRSGGAVSTRDRARGVAPAREHSGQGLLGRARRDRGAARRLPQPRRAATRAESGLGRRERGPRAAGPPRAPARRGGRRGGRR